MAGNRKDIVGNIYGRLTVKTYHHSANETTYWECECVCGNKKVISKNSLTQGCARSCGCLKKEYDLQIGNGKRFISHGDTMGGKVSPEYNSWSSMISRCTDPNNRSFFRYGMRGISVCERWLHSFENFLADMGRKPTSRHSIDRFPNNKGNYCLENCRWATPKQQQENRSTTKWMEYNGEKMTMKDWSIHLKIPYSTFQDRLKKLSLAEIIETQK